MDEEVVVVVMVMLMVYNWIKKGWWRAAMARFSLIIWPCAGRQSTLRGATLAHAQPHGDRLACVCPPIKIARARMHTIRMVRLIAYSLCPRARSPHLLARLYDLRLAHCLERVGDVGVLVLD